jgi:hypothetical protein
VVTLSPLDIKFETKTGKFYQNTAPSEYDYTPRSKSDVVVTQPTYVRRVPRPSSRLARDFLDNDSALGEVLDNLKLPSRIESKLKRVALLEQELGQLMEMNNARRRQYSSAWKGNTGLLR